MRRAVALVTLLLTSCIPHPDGTPSSSEDPVLILNVGDSISVQYGPYFRDLVPHHGAHAWVSAWSGSNPLDHPWSAWLDAWKDEDDHAPLDYIVIQDNAVPGLDVTGTETEWLDAWQTFVDVARTALRPDGRVLVLDGNRPDLSSVEGIDAFLPVIPSDAPDGVHWTEEGAIAEAHLLCEQLSQGAACPR